MDKINFENLPSTNTPINADNLNQFQTNVETEINKKETTIKELIEKELYYKDGDTFDASTLVVAGIITADKSSIRFSVPVNKKLDNINTITASLTRCQIRHSDGGYIANNVDLATLGKITVTKGAGNTLFVDLTLTTASTLGNNCPVNVVIVNGTFMFNK